MQRLQHSASLRMCPETREYAHLDQMMYSFQYLMLHDRINYKSHVLPALGANGTPARIGTSWTERRELNYGKLWLLAACNQLQLRCPMPTQGKLQIAAVCQAHLFVMAKLSSMSNCGTSQTAACQAAQKQNTLLGRKLVNCTVLHFCRSPCEF